MEEQNTKLTNQAGNMGIISFEGAQRDTYELDLHSEFAVGSREGKYYDTRRSTTVSKRP